MSTTHEVAPGTTEALRTMSNKEMVIAIVTMQTQIAQLTAKFEELSKPPAKAETKEMTDDDARKIMYGDLAVLKHKDAAEKLGLTYGQVYSCRLGFTFKNIHKEMKEQGKINAWIKA